MKKSDNLGGGIFDSHCIVTVTQKMSLILQNVV